MRLLYDPEKQTTDVYTFKVNQGGPLNIRVSNGGDRNIKITFVNGRLESVEHNLGDFNLRSNWHIFGAVAEKISEIEAGYGS